VGTAARKVRIPDSVTGFVRGTHPYLKRKIKSSLKMILETPTLGKELRDDLLGLRSFRVSKFRIIYRVRKDVIEVIAIGPRERICEETLVIVRREQATQ
jgi:mRNA interferase RelE/StbE